jgi:hypothetical protein
MRAPDPALLDAVPSGDLGGARGGAASSVLSDGRDGDGDEAGLLRLGPLTLVTAGLQRQFRIRQVRGGRGARQGAAGGGRRARAPQPAQSSAARRRACIRAARPACVLPAPARRCLTPGHLLTRSAPCCMPPWACLPPLGLPSPEIPRQR